MKLNKLMIASIVAASMTGSAFAVIETPEGVELDISTSVAESVTLEITPDGDFDVSVDSDGKIESQSDVAVGTADIFSNAVNGFNIQVSNSASEDGLDLVTRAEPSEGFQNNISVSSLTIEGVTPITADNMASGAVTEGQIDNNAAAITVNIDASELPVLAGDYNASYTFTISSESAPSEE